MNLPKKYLLNRKIHKASICKKRFQNYLKKTKKNNNNKCRIFSQRWFFVFAHLYSKDTIFYCASILSTWAISSFLILL